MAPERNHHDLTHPYFKRFLGLSENCENPMPFHGKSVIMFLEIDLSSKQNVENARFPGTRSFGNISRSIFQLISHSIPMKQLLLYPGKRICCLDHEKKIIWTANNHTMLAKLAIYPMLFPVNHMDKSRKNHQIPHPAQPPLGPGPHTGAWLSADTLASDCPCGAVANSARPPGFLGQIFAGKAMGDVYLFGFSTTGWPPARRYTHIYIYMYIYIYIYIYIGLIYCQAVFLLVI